MSLTIPVKVKLFAVLREEIGTEELNFELPQGVSCREVVSHLKSRFPHLIPLFQHSLVALNGSYIGQDTKISPDDEVAILPPVSGG